MKAITLTVLAGLFSHFSNAQIIVLVSSVGKITGISANGVGEFRYENSHRGTPKHGRITKIGTTEFEYENSHRGTPKHGRITKIGTTEFEYENSHRGTPKYGRLTKVGAISISYDTNNKISNIINTTRADVKVVVAIAIDQNGKPL
ncbi:hypothetical protein ACS5NO_13820 [Larkinella sp. GY13]|uniref:hypothetical protein n=1 Tax=Larkinella sp. GY13 TaxID=3453720 RepID=UPI003EEEAAAD